MIFVLLIGIGSVGIASNEFSLLYPFEELFHLIFVLDCRLFTNCFRCSFVPEAPAKYGRG